MCSSSVLIMGSRVGFYSKSDHGVTQGGNVVIIWSFEWPNGGDRHSQLKLSTDTHAVCACGGDSKLVSGIGRAYIYMRQSFLLPLLWQSFCLESEVPLTR